MKTHFRSAVFLAVLGCMTIRGLGYQVVARQDVDSLYYSSQTVVKAEIGPSHPEQTVDGNCVVYEVKVLEVLKGEAAVGKTYKLTGLDEFKHAPGLPGRPDSWNPLEAGEVVYLFAVPNGKAGYSKYRLVEADWTVRESGARLEAGGNVYAFSQPEVDFSDHAPAWQKAAPMAAQVAMTPMVFPKALVYSEKEFHARLESARSVQADVDKALKADASEAQIQALVEMLHGRRTVMQAEGAQVDLVARALGQRLAEIGTGKPEVLDALYQDAPRDLRMVLEEAFANGRGVAYLQEHIADEKALMEKRLAWGELLTSAEHAAARSPNLRDAGLPVDLEVQLARLAVANLNNALGAALLRGLPQGGLGGSASADALTVLQEGFAKATPAQKYAIAECAMQLDIGKYRSMFSGLGMFLTLAEPDWDFAAGLKKGELDVSFRFRGSIFLALKVVLRPTGGGADRVLELTSQPELPQHGSTFGGGWHVVAALPADIPAGKYYLFLRADGDGLGFDVEIPSR